jgi:hypothetical protein
MVGNVMTKHKAEYWLEQIDKNPEKFGITESHIREVKRSIKHDLELQEKNIKLGERNFEIAEREKKQKTKQTIKKDKSQSTTPKTPIETVQNISKHSLGMIVRVQGRIGKIIKINSDTTTIRFHTGNDKEYSTLYISICRNQEEMQQKFKDAENKVKR